MLAIVLDQALATLKQTDMSDILARLDSAALSALRSEFLRRGDIVSLTEFAEILFRRLPQDVATAIMAINIFDCIQEVSLSWTQFLDFMIQSTADSQSPQLDLVAEHFAIEDASDVLMDTTRHAGKVQAVRVKQGTEFEIITAEEGVPGLQVYKKTGKQGVVRVPGERIVPGTFLALPEEFGDVGVYCRDFACSDLVTTATFAGEFVAATLNRRAVVVWEHGRGYKSQWRGTEVTEEGGDRIWWTRKLKVFLVSIQKRSQDFYVALLDPVTMRFVGVLPQNFGSRIVAASDVQSIAGAEFITVVEESGTVHLFGLAREDPRVGIQCHSIVDVKCKITSAELHNSLWFLGCLDGSIIVFDSVNSLTVRVMQEHKTTIRCVTIARDHLISREDRGDMIVWNLKTFVPCQKLTSISRAVNHMIAMDNDLILTASDTRFHFMRSTSGLPAHKPGAKSSSATISTVHLDYRQHRLVVVSAESIIAVDLALNKQTLILPCPGILASTLECCHGVELACVASGNLKFVNLLSGQIVSDYPLLENRRVFALCFLAGGKKLAVLSHGGLLRIFAGGRLIGNLTLPWEMHMMSPLNVQSNNQSTLICLWSHSINQVALVREAARIGKSELSIEGHSHDVGLANALAIGSRCGDRVGECAGLVFACGDRLVLTDQTGARVHEIQCDVGDKITHVCHVRKSSLAEISASVVAKFSDALTFSLKKSAKGGARPASGLGDWSFPSEDVAADYFVVGESSTGRVRVFDGLMKLVVSLQVDGGFQQLVSIPGYALVATVAGPNICLWPVCGSFDPLFQGQLQAGSFSVQRNSMYAYNETKERLGLWLSRRVLSREVENSPRQATVIQIAATSESPVEPPRRLAIHAPAKKTREDMRCPSTPRTLSNEFLRVYLSRGSSEAEKVHPGDAMKSTLAEELDIVDQQFQAKKEEVHVETKRNEWRLSTKLAYSVAGDVYRTMNDTMKISDFVSEYGRVLSLRSLKPAKALSRMSTAPTRTHTAKK